MLLNIYHPISSFNLLKLLAQNKYLLTLDTVIIYIYKKQQKQKTKSKQKQQFK